MERTEMEINRPGTKDFLMARKAAVAGIFGSVLLAGAHQAVAAGWEISPNVTLSETFLDNSGQALTDQSNHEYVSEVTPSLGVRKEGRRVKLSALYRLQNLWYSNASDLDNSYQQYAASVNAELLRKVLFLDLSTTRTQQIIDPNNVVTFDNLATTSNRTDVTTYSAKPSYAHQFGDFAEARVNGSFDHVSYSDSATADSDNIGYFASLASGNRFDRVDWIGSFKRVEFLQRQNKNDEYYQTLLLDFGYKFRKRLTFIAGVGYENSNIQNTDTGESGGSWKIGAKWEPTPRTSVTGTVGQRFFGNSASFQLVHQQKTSQLRINFVQNITHVSQLALGNNVFDSTFANTNTGGGGNTTVLTPNVPAVSENISSPSITTGLFLSKRWSASYIKKTHRSLFNLRGFHENRELTVGGTNENVFGGDSSWAWAIGSRTTSTLSGRWERQKLAAAGKQDDDIWSAGVEITHQIGKNSQGSIGARRVKRDSPSSALNYEQTQIALKLVIGLY